ncbi:MAG: SAM-dependent DNA methyltransferase [Candidatus Riesia sp.]|nr:SAM-dependent DNA methyltransferase [Candidatus Riesia sp.]
MSISTVVKGIQDIMRKDSGVDGDAQRISQMVWMIFLKVLDDKEKNFELLDDNYQSPIPDKYKWRNWAIEDEGLTGDELLEFIDELFKELKNLTVTEDDRKAAIIQSAFADTYNYMKSGTLLRQVINKINEIDFGKIEDRHIFNDIYEKILKDLQSAGNAGEFYTPRAVTQFIVDMVDPKLGETVFDPACGTGGFLICALQPLRKQVKTPKDKKTLETSIFGIEKKQLPHLLSVTNMILHDVETPLIEHDNSLSTFQRSYSAKDKVDVIITNPPFGGVEEDGVESNFPQKFQTRETADLFLVLILHRLKDKGRCGIVLPDGTLFGEGVKTRIKEELLSTCNLHTIVRLPNGVFAPYTGIKTNLLFFEKGSPTKEIWFYEHPYPAGYKSYSKTKPIKIKEFKPEKKWWNSREENEFAWKVTLEEIQEKNYNLDFKNPHQVEEDLGDPIELLAEYKELMQDVSATRDQLKQELENALRGNS